MSRAELAGLIDSGKLELGSRLSHEFRDRRTVTASVVDDGLEYDGQTYSTPSAAARMVTRKPVDGWAFWRLPDGSPLGSLRG